jgi:hypothetical protein
VNAPVNHYLRFESEEDELSVVMDVDTDEEGSEEAFDVDVMNIDMPKKRTESSHIGNLKPRPQPPFENMFDEREVIVGRSGMDYVDMNQERYASAAYGEEVSLRSIIPLRDLSAAEILAETQFKIFLFDSLNLSHTQLGKRLRQYVLCSCNDLIRYLEIEAEQKRGVKIDHTQMNKSESRTRVPRQLNSWYFILC